MHKFIFYILLFFLQVFGWAIVALADPTPTTNLCANPILGDLVFSGKIIVHQRQINQFAINKNPMAAVREQLLYLNGDVHFGSLSGKEIILLQENRIKVRKVSSTNYGRDLLIDDANREDVLKKSDNALLIEYDAEQEIVFCAKPKNPGPLLAVELPIDPYNAYWLVPKSERVLVQSNNREIYTNPCADKEIAQVPGAHHYWYTWNAKRSDKCEQILQPDRDYQIISAKFVPRRPIKYLGKLHELKLSSPIDMGLIFGFVSENNPTVSIKDAKAFFRRNEKEISKLVKQGIALPAQNKESQDAAVWAILDFFDQIHTAASFDSLSIDQKEQYLLLTAEGHLKFSKKIIRIRVYLGDIHPDSKEYRESILSLLNTSNIFFYIGHAEGGKNIDWNKLGSTPETFSKNQFIGIISCFATSFFHLKNLAMQRGSTLFLADFQQYRYLVPLGLLQFLDKNTSLKNNSLSSTFEKFVSKDETFLLLNY